MVSEALTDWDDDNSDMHADLLTVGEAATIYHVTEARIRQWKKRGHLAPAGLDEFGRPLFTGVDVLRAEATAAANRRRTQGLNLATRHATPAT